jgi:hypothetical protein
VSPDYDQALFRPQSYSNWLRLSTRLPPFVLTVCSGPLEALEMPPPGEGVALDRQTARVIHFIDSHHGNLAMVTKHLKGGNIHLIRNLVTDVFRPCLPPYELPTAVLNSTMAVPQQQAISGSFAPSDTAVFDRIANIDAFRTDVEERDYDKEMKRRWKDQYTARMRMLKVFHHPWQA